MKRRQISEACHLVSGLIFGLILVHFSFKRCSHHPPEHPLTLEQVLQSQQSLLPLGPVGAGAVVQHLGHVLRLTQVVRRHAAVARAVRALGAGAGGVAVGVVVRVHSRRLKAPPHRPPLSGRRQDGGVQRQKRLKSNLDLLWEDLPCSYRVRAMQVSDDGMWDGRGYFMLFGLSPLTSELMIKKLLWLERKLKSMVEILQQPTSSDSFHKQSIPTCSLCKNQCLTLMLCVHACSDRKVQLCQTRCICTLLLESPKSWNLQSPGRKRTEGVIALKILGAVSSHPLSI